VWIKVGNKKQKIIMNDQEEILLPPDSENEDEEVIEEEGAPLSAYDTKLALALRVISQMRSQLENLQYMLEGRSSPEEVDRYMVNARRNSDDDSTMGFSGRVIDGVFDGERMIGEDGSPYLVPPNYASKSKLVEGDLLRLNIGDNGRFIFKQKGPIERQRLVGTLVQDELSSDWKVVADGQSFKVLAAAVSFHRGSTGDDAVILVPKNAPSRWGALENIIKRSEDDWNG
jgi:hypothetical protein